MCEQGGVEKYGHFVINFAQGIYWFVYLQSQKNWLQTQLNAGTRIISPSPGLVLLHELLYSQTRFPFIIAKQQKRLHSGHPHNFTPTEEGWHLSQLDSHWPELGHMCVPEPIIGGRGTGSQ